MSGAGFCSMAGIVDAVACDAIANEERERENVGNTAGLQRVGRSLALTVFRWLLFSLSRFVQETRASSDETRKG